MAAMTQQAAADQLEKQQVRATLGVARNPARGCPSGVLSMSFHRPWGPAHFATRA